MGRSKQLLPLQGEPLLLHSVKAALNSSASPIVVVLGARADEHHEIIKHLPVQKVTNAQWERGMGSSLKAGLAHVTETYPEAEGAIIMTCDQPHVSGSLLEQLIRQHIASGKSIIASLYKDSPGVPVLFSKKHFHELLIVDDAQGAKKVIMQHKNDLALLPFPEGAVDLDTLEDYNTFIKK